MDIECGSQSELIKDAFQHLRQEASDFYLRETVPVVQHIAAFDFFRNYVSPNLPVVIKGGCSHLKAITKWNSRFLRETLGEKEVNIAVTPNGYADAVAAVVGENGVSKEYFVMPEERTMLMSHFLDVLERPKEHKGIFYLQSQNNNLNQHFPELVDDVEGDVPWATEAFGSKPDAVNFWIGDCRAVTSLHKDPYENIYCVISGYKDFILLPPTDRPWIPYKTYPKATYLQGSNGSFSVEPCGEEDGGVPWICIDPLNPDLETYPRYKNASPIYVRVNAGDVLYLPSLWYHHVRQSHACIAVNYWYDMQFDIKYVYYQMLDFLASAAV